jgi:hypothetical protein
MLKKNFFKFFLAIFLSIIFSNFLIKNVFIANSPKIRPNLDYYLAQKFFPKDLFNKISKRNNVNNAQFQNKGLIFSQINKNNFIPINKGVYATDLKKGNYILIKENEVEWVIYTFSINGKEIKIKVPKGEPTPNQKVLEALYK